MNLLDLDKTGLTELVIELGYPAYRANQIAAWLYRDIRSFEEMSDLPSKLREQLSERASRGLPQLLREQKSKDGASKVLWSFQDGNTAESVLMNYRHGLSACISTQAGCRMGCVFCASSKGGFIRNLTNGEMMGQYLGLRILAGHEIRHAVLMGMGEPLDNLDNVLLFLSKLRDFSGLSMRNVSVSTCGLPDGISKLSMSGFPVTLSVSLHAPDDETRSKLMPVNRRHSVLELLSSCHQYFERTGRRVSYEYTMIDGVNDSDGQARLLAKLLSGREPAHVNLIPCNPVPGCGFRPSKRIDIFRRLLEHEGVNVTVRRRLGRDIDAACGQLRNRAGVTRS